MEPPYLLVELSEVLKDVVFAALLQLCTGVDLSKPADKAATINRLIAN